MEKKKKKETKETGSLSLCVNKSQLIYYAKQLTFLALSTAC